MNLNYYTSHYFFLFKIKQILQINLIIIKKFLNFHLLEGAKRLKIFIWNQDPLKGPGT